MRAGAQLGDESMVAEGGGEDWRGEGEERIATSGLEPKTEE